MTWHAPHRTLLQLHHTLDYATIDGVTSSLIGRGVVRITGIQCATIKRLP